MISLAQTAILLAAAVVAVSVFRFARLSSILGYLVAGLVIGPWGLNLIGDVGRILQVSEFGIVLLLFIIGLELQPTRLWVMRRIVFGYGPAQVALCSLLLGAGAWALGVPPIAQAPRSEEHTSELQSLTNIVCRLLLVKKKQSQHIKQLLL